MKLFYFSSKERHCLNLLIKSEYFPDTLKEKFPEVDFRLYNTNRRKYYKEILNTFSEEKLLNTFLPKINLKFKQELTKKHILQFHELDLLVATLL